MPSALHVAAEAGDGPAPPLPFFILSRPCQCPRSRAATIAGDAARVAQLLEAGENPTLRHIRWGFRVAYDVAENREVCRPRIALRSRAFSHLRAQPRHHFCRCATPSDATWGRTLLSGIGRRHTYRRLSTTRPRRSVRRGNVPRRRPRAESHPGLVCPLGFALRRAECSRYTTHNDLCAGSREEEAGREGAKRAAAAGTAEDIGRNTL